MLCKGKLGVEPKVIPTQVDDCLFGRDGGTLGGHQTNRKTLVKALFIVGYRYPDSFGGLAALVDELVENREFC